MFCLVTEIEKYDENLHEKVVEQGGGQKRYYFENLKISVPQIKLSVFTSNKLPLDLKVHQRFHRVKRSCWGRKREQKLFTYCFKFPFTKSTKQAIKNPPHCGGAELLLIQLVGSYNKIETLARLLFMDAIMSILLWTLSCTSF